MHPHLLQGLGLTLSHPDEHVDDEEHKEHHYHRKKLVDNQKPITFANEFQWRLVLSIMNGISHAVNYQRNTRNIKKEGHKTVVLQTDFSLILNLCAIMKSKDEYRENNVQDNPLFIFL